MIVPPNSLPSPYSSPANDDNPQPSQAQLLMAAAQMHKLGRMSNQPPRFQAPPKPKQKAL